VALRQFRRQREGRTAGSLHAFLLEMIGANSGVHNLAKQPEAAVAAPAYRR
jgi:hypothetical protein